MIEELESENKEICGFMNIIFYPEKQVIEATANSQGFLNLQHIVDYLLAKKVLEVRA